MKVSICMITYNHEAFISKAIESILMQETTFNFELIIGEDYSTDNTRSIILSYKDKYPDKIKLLKNESNIGMIPNFKATILACTGEFIAICEGDDYWVDPLKLQKQVAFMDANPDYSICFHRVYEESENVKKISSTNKLEKEYTYTIEDLAKKNFIHTPSVLFRNNLVKAFPCWFYQSPVGDYVLHMLNAQYGKIKYFPDIMATYRKHEGGVWSTQNRSNVLERWLQVLDYLLIENFDQSVLNELNLQKKNYQIEYLKILLNHDFSLFKQKLQILIHEDPKLVDEWLFVQYPLIINELNKSNNEIKSSKTYKFSVLLSSLKNKVEKALGSYSSKKL
jgi:glycosyltransferase involved in cell wall biosynthesis